MLRSFFILVGGGGLGAAIRELLMHVVGSLPGGFPMPIFIANIVAAFLIGLLTGLASKGAAISSNMKLFLITGVLGGLSTFSSLIWGTVQMFAQPTEQITAMIYLLMSIIVGFIAVESGLAAGAALMRPSIQPSGAQE